mmetsp:Transcript_95847/g.254586  ORF Transcript_95847/g.254586 Transcript_95847/m.254586 type:complete len:245 (+) Transcript_95847:2-736(+)
MHPGRGAGTALAQPYCRCWPSCGRPGDPVRSRGGSGTRGVRAVALGLFSPSFARSLSCTEGGSLGAPQPACSSLPAMRIRGSTQPAKTLSLLVFSSSSCLRFDCSLVICCANSLSPWEFMSMRTSRLWKALLRSSTSVRSDSSRSFTREPRFWRSSTIARAASAAEVCSCITCKDLSCRAISEASLSERLVVVPTRSALSFASASRSSRTSSRKLWTSAARCCCSHSTFACRLPSSTCRPFMMA